MNLALQSLESISPPKHVDYTWVEVTSAARLHMGFFDLHGGLGRQFGSIGLSLNAPQLQLRAQKNNQFKVSFSTNSPCTDTIDAHAIQTRTQHIAQVLLGDDVRCDNVALHFSTMITPHAGLGSGTQFALSVGMAINQLFGLGLSVAQIAEKTGRGKRSGIGIAAFSQGGLIIDGGRASDADNATPPILARYDFPEAWCVLLIEDTTQAGIHGAAEIEAFKTLPRFSEDLAAHLCRHVLMQTMPAMLAEDLATFGASIHALQAHVGDYFAPAQGGRYASQAVGQVLEYLIANRAPCVGQSSWGPTGFAVFENRQSADDYLAIVKTKFSHYSLAWRICHGNNRGATVCFG